MSLFLTEFHLVFRLSLRNIHSVCNAVVRVTVDDESKNKPCGCGHELVDLVGLDDSQVMTRRGLTICLERGLTIFPLWIRLLYLRELALRCCIVYLSICELGGESGERDGLGNSTCLTILLGPENAPFYFKLHTPSTFCLFYFWFISPSFRLMVNVQLEFNHDCWGQTVKQV